MSREHLFRFKQFAVEHGRSSLKVGTDAVLLGAWCDVSGVGATGRVLDVGTGCGVIALMVAQRTAATVRVDAIDIDEASVDEAARNAAASPWAERLQVALGDFNDWTCPDEDGYDLIVSNPPFFDNGVLPPDQARCRARHGVTLTLQRLIEHSAELLSQQGSLALITPVEASEAVVAAAAAAGLKLLRRTQVLSVADAPPRRVLWQFAVTSDAVECNEDTLVIMDGERHYTDQYARLTHDFYLWA